MVTSINIVRPKNFSTEISTENMAGTECIDFLEKERISIELKHQMNDWKEIVVLFNAVIVWKKNWYPLITIACVTCFYLYLWLANYSIFNLVWAIGLLFTLLDCFICGPFQRFLPPDNWDQHKERTYTEFCESMTNFCITFKLYVERFFKLRQTNKIMFHAVLFVSFFSLLYIGSILNNLFLSYITVLVILLLPGYKTRSDYIEEIVQKYAHQMMLYLCSINKIKSS